MTDGYVKISRSIMEWRWYKDANTFRLFFHLIAKANYAEKPWNDIVIHRGEFVTSYAALSADLGLTVKEVRSALGKLKRTGEVASTSTSKYTVISIKNYDLYQTEGKQTGRQRASEGQAEGKQGATTKKDNKDKNIKEVEIKEKNIKKENFSVPTEIAEAFAEFEKMRNRIKKPMTDRAKRDALAKLEKLAPQDYELQNKILDQSIFNCYVGVFPLKEENGGGGYGQASGTADNRLDGDRASLEKMSVVVV